jgi:2-polyprenyl-3-methyl-5-hydroxy-6-metoxy-1,4-benzoquinol methylase
MMRDIDDYTRNYSEHPFEDIQSSYRQKKVSELLNSHKHKNILEVGCGFYPIFNFFDDFENLVISEPSTVFCENANTTLLRSGNLASRVIIINDYFENSIEELQKHDFDYIIISCLLHEIENVPMFLERLLQILKKDTVVYIDVPNAFSFHRLLALEMGLIGSIFEMSPSNILLQQQIVFDMGTLSKLIADSGFKIINSGTYFIKPFSHKQMSELLGHKIIDKKVLDGLYEMIKYMPDLGSELFVEFKIMN